jgi:MFS family permease
MLKTIRLTTAGFMGLFLHGIVVAAPGAFLPQWVSAFGETVSVGAFYIAFLLSSVAGLYVSSKGAKRHPLFTLSFTAVAIALGLVAVSPTFGGVIAAAVLLGFGDGILNLQCNSLVGELHPQRRIVVLNWANATFGLGALSAPLLGGFLPWRLAFGLTAILALASAMLAWQAPEVPNFVPKRDRLAWAQAQPFLLVILIYVGLESAIGTWSGTYLRYLGWSVTWSSALLSLYWGGLTLGRLMLGPWISSRPIRGLQLLLLAGLTVVSLTLFPPLGILFALVAFFYGPTFATVFALLQEQCGHVALSYLFYAAYIGKTSVPAALSLIENPAYLPYSFILLAIALYALSLRLYRSKPNMSVDQPY